MLDLLTILGGVALLLFGVRYLRKGLDRLLGKRLGTWLQRIGSRRGLSFVSGIGAAFIAPSSTTISLVAVQTVQAGQMTAGQMIAVVLGANIGMTMLVQLVAVRLDALAPVLILFGVLFFQFTRGARTRGVGQIVLGLGFIFMGIGVIRSAVEASDLAAHADFTALVEIVVKYPVVLALVAAAVTVLLQSSTATIGLVIGLGSAGAVTLDLAVPVIIGANIGVSCTTLIVGFGHVESRRLALANLALKTVVAVIGIGVLAMIGGELLRPTPERTAFWIAQIHTIFNVAVAAIGLPAAPALARLAERVVPLPPPGQSGVFGPRFINRRGIGGTTMALGQSMHEILHVSEIVRSMLEDAWRALHTNDERLAREVGERDDQVDLLDSEIKRFLTRIVREETDDEHAHEQIRQLRYLNELEDVGDCIDKGISDLVVKKIRLGTSFTDEGVTELDDFFNKVLENLVLANTTFTTRDPNIAHKLVRHKERLDRYDQELRDRHFARLRGGLVQSHETSAVHLDLLTHLKRINSCVTHVAFDTLRSGPTDRAHDDAVSDHAD